MRKYLLISLTLVALGSCTKDIERFNEQKKSAATAPPATLFSNGVRNYVDAMTSANVNTNVFRLTVQHWATTTYQDEPNYDFTTRLIPQLWWRTMYRDVLVDLQEAKRLIPDDITIAEGTKKNQTAIVDIMQVMAYETLVNTFGDVPYSEALDFNKVFPKYDDAKTIYDDLIKRLDADIAALNPASNGFSAADDLIYGSISSESNRVNAWKKLANSVKLRLGITIADADPAQSKTVVEQASAGAFTSAADNAIFKYQATTPNTNPIWVDLVQSNRQDFVIGTTLIESMKTLSDPRIPLYFKPNDAGQYVGGKIGSNNTFPLFAKPNDKIVAPDFPGVLMTFDEVEFIRAEAIERGYAVGGSAKEHYDNAVRASIVFWGGTEAAAGTYLSQPGLSYTTAPGNYKQKIGTQKWIALYNRPVEGWTEVRRLDYPVLPPPANPDSEYPTRFTYPGNEQTLNPTNYTAAAAKIGKDEVTTKIFWDKF
ncbi:SusD/RagB family nutrient-binding outer membrane lipoprotein [Segetibacter sp. 3557_3]|nr:SusD/RagB family nutrient-binding outer membrane lipoprotein [Segetibacter sp. 3557_3]